MALSFSRPSLGQTLPPPPVDNYNQQPLPEVEPNSGVPEIEFRPEQQYQVAPTYEYNQYNQNYNQNGRYVVLVDNSDERVLQLVRQFEPTAFRRQFQGRRVIQAGTFNREEGARERLRQVQSYGVYNAQIVSLANGQQIPNYPNNNNYGYGRPQPSSYYVVIPALAENLDTLRSQVISRIGQSSGVEARNNPRGAHVAVGPFARRLEAEQWNNYLRRSGFGNARVYYER